MNAITLFFYSYYKHHKPFVCTETTITFCNNILLLVVTTATTPSFYNNVRPLLATTATTPSFYCNVSPLLVTTADHFILL